MSHITKIVMVVASAALVATGTTAPAQADQHTFKDRRGDLRSGLDVRTVKVTNNGPWIKFRSRHRNLKYGPHVRGGVVAFFIDTIPRRKGPEFKLYTPVGFHSEYYLMKTRRWKTVPPGMGLGCRIKANINYRKDAVWFAVKRVCLANAYLRKVGRIRVSVRATQIRKGPNRRDWAPKRRHFYPAVLKS